MKLVKLSKLIDYKAGKNGSRTALLYRDYSMGKWIDVSWNDLKHSVDCAARALVSLGVKEQQPVGICSQNMPQAIVVDFANFANRAISVPMYATLSPEQMEYIINDAHIEVICIGEQLQYDNVYQVLQKKNTPLKHVIVFDHSVNLKNEPKAIYFNDFIKLGESDEHAKTVADRTSAATDDDLAIIMYTSGTTGESKGVMLKHSSILEAMRIHDERLTMLNKHDVSLSFLPMSHIFERAWVYLMLYENIKIYLNLRPSEIQSTIKEVRPTLLCSVPRFWEKIAAGVQEKIDTFTPFKKAMVTWALAIGRDFNINYRRIGKRAPLSLYLRYKFADRFIFSILKKIVGINRGRLFPVSGAALDSKLADFFLSMGLPICYGYGLTETTATVCCYPTKNYTIGSIGTVMPGVQVALGDDNEILVKGKTVCAGYYNRPEATADAFVDGWFRTGDAGHIDGDTVYMVERIKDLFKTSNGKYIAPQQIETILGADRYIEQIAVIGNNRNYVTAIIAPNIPAVKDLAESMNIKYERVEELLHHPDIISFFEKRIAEGQKEMAPYEKIKKFRLIKRAFSIESGELTSTLKLRRAVIQQNYAVLINDMYDTVDGPAGTVIK